MSGEDVHPKAREPHLPPLVGKNDITLALAEPEAGIVHYSEAFLSPVCDPTAAI